MARSRRPAAFRCRLGHDLIVAARVERLIDNGLAEWQGLIRQLARAAEARTWAELWKRGGWGRKPRLRYPPRWTRAARGIMAGASQKEAARKRHVAVRPCHARLMRANGKGAAGRR